MGDSTIIISSNVLNYQGILESPFLDFLKKEGASEKTRNNYRTDLRHFIHWVSITIQTTSTTLPQNHIHFIRNLTPEILTHYRQSLLGHGTPSATINRRLSTLRSFFRFCIAHGWLDRNPIETVRNIKKKHRPDGSIDQMLTAFQSQLTKEGLTDRAIEEQLHEVKAFLQWVQNHT